MFGKEKSQYIEDSKFRYTMREIKKNGSAYVLALPYFLLFLIFTGIPVVISLPIGFTSFNMVQFPTWVGLNNFYTLFLQDDVFLIAIQNTLVFAIITGPVSYILCFLLAWLINEMPGALKTVFTYIFYAPTLAGNIFATWQLIFSGDTYGFLNSTLMDLGLIKGPQQWLTDARYILMCVIVVQMWMSLGAGFLSLRAGFQG
ncbi:MAG: sugar ABC transporter permease, partial [Oscillospiraceae bacterium]|nr:sugar ABC transporter permease [Oscillospiraceae bacterium]